MTADRRDLRRRLFALAADQGGYFTASQAKETGYSYQAQAYHVGAGNWLRIDRGLFRLTEWIPDRNDDLIRWTLWSKGRAVVSHESALAVHGIGEFEASRVHLAVPTRFSMRNSAVVLHHADLPDRTSSHTRASRSRPSSGRSSMSRASPTRINSRARSTRRARPDG